jgi:hypothetical protein
MLMAHTLMKKEVKEEVRMHDHNSPGAELLLLPQTDEKELVLYNDNPYSYEMPKIGPRPPFYAHPRYEKEYPVI